MLHFVNIRVELRNRTKDEGNFIILLRYFYTSFTAESTNISNLRSTERSPNANLGGHDLIYPQTSGLTVCTIFSTQLLNAMHTLSNTNYSLLDSQMLSTPSNLAVSAQKLTPHWASPQNSIGSEPSSQLLESRMALLKSGVANRSGHLVKYGMICV